MLAFAVGFVLLLDSSSILNFNAYVFVMVVEDFNFGSFEIVFFLFDNISIINDSRFL